MKTMLMAALMLAVSGTALAHNCPNEMKAIDAALGKASLSVSQMDEVRKLRAEGERLHKDGRHDDSMATLAKAKKLLGI